MTDSFDEDLTSVCLLKNNGLVATSSQDSTISLLKWDYFDECTDRITTHPSSIDSMIKFDEDTVITGSEDGMVRAVSVHPNKILSIINSDVDIEDLVPISAMSLSHD